MSAVDFEIASLRTIRFDEKVGREEKGKRKKRVMMIVS